MKQKKSLNIPVSDREALLHLTLHMRGAWAHSDAEVSKLAEIAEQRLDRMNMPMSKRKGVIATHVTQGPAAGAYRFPVGGALSRCAAPPMDGVSSTLWPRRFFRSRGER